MPQIKDGVLEPPAVMPILPVRHLSRLRGLVETRSGLSSELSLDMVLRKPVEAGVELSGAGDLIEEFGVSYRRCPACRLAVLDSHAAAHDRPRVGSEFAVRLSRLALETGSAPTLRPTAASALRRQRGPGDRGQPAAAHSTGKLSCSVGLIGTYPPTRCGIATFTASLARALAGCGIDVGVVSCVDQAGSAGYGREVVGEWVRGCVESLEQVVASLKVFDTVVIQHEFGIFGGRDGEEVLELAGRLKVPIIVVLHSVPSQPSPRQRAIIERLGAVAERTVAQSRAARSRLLADYDVAPERVVVIQHGAPANLAPQVGSEDPARRPTILTWGLIGPGKGIEFAIDAVAQLADLVPKPCYLILGETHPKIVAHSGEAYRKSLIARVQAHDADQLVTFLDGYRDTDRILAEVRKADIVVLPYLSRDQTVSGVLVEAIASGKPVVATAFPHAVELLADGSGIVVPHEDADQLAQALRLLLTDPSRADEVAAAARSQAPTLFWENIGHAYLRLALAVLTSAPVPRTQAAIRQRSQLRALGGRGVNSRALQSKEER